MGNFTVWYVLMIFQIGQGNTPTANLAIAADLPSCERAAARFLAANPPNTVKWACHEMTVNVTAKETQISFPNY